jgi:hypothetical protein
MEGIIIELARSLAAQGAAYTLLTIVGAALAYVTAKWVKSKQECFELSNALNEKRVTERSETISVLHAGVQSNLKLAESISVRTETLNNLVVVFTAGIDRLERGLLENKRAIEDAKRFIDDLARGLADVMRSIEDLRRGQVV